MQVSSLAIIPINRDDGFLLGFLKSLTGLSGKIGKEFWF